MNALERALRGRYRLVWWSVPVLLAEVAVTMAYYMGQASMTDPWAVVLPWLWIDAAIVAAIVMPWRRPGVIATGVGLLYLGLLLVASGAVGLGGDGGWRIAMLAPPWGPAIVHGGGLQIYLMPFQAIAFVVLAAMLSQVVQQRARQGWKAVGGMAACPSCSLTALGGAIGLSVPVLGSWSYPVATVALTGTMAWLARTVIAEPSGSCTVGGPQTPTSGSRLIRVGP